MPCRDYESDYYESKKLQDHLNILARVACNCCQVLEAAGKIDEISDESKKWWTAHKIADAKREAEEKAEERRKTLRANALAKLTAAEKKVLGVSK